MTNRVRLPRPQRMHSTRPPSGAAGGDHDAYFGELGRLLEDWAAGRGPS